MLGFIKTRLIHGGYVVECADRGEIFIKDLPAVLEYTERYFKEVERENNPDLPQTEMPRSKL